jgi:murein DD-endopeptidase MepM/ murein hydrolase activator NlpD
MTRLLFIVAFMAALGAFIFTYVDSTQVNALRVKEIYRQMEQQAIEQRMHDMQWELNRLKQEKPMMTLSKKLSLPLKDAGEIVTQGYGQNLLAYGGMGLDGHPGIDFAIPEGTPIYASHDGIVFESYGCVLLDSCVGYGKRVKLRARDGQRGIETVYAHLSRLNVRLGDPVRTGDLIGWSGNTGFSSRPHLHFGVRNLWYCDNGTQVKFPCEVLDGGNGMMGWIDPAGMLGMSIAPIAR